MKSLLSFLLLAMLLTACSSESGVLLKVTDTGEAWPNADDATVCSSSDGSNIKCQNCNASLESQYCELTKPFRGSVYCRC